MSEDLAQKRFADCVKIYQIHRPARSLRQFGYQRQFLAGRKPVAGIYRQVHITVPPLPASSQRTEQNGQSDPGLHVESGQDRSYEILILH